MSWPYCEDMLDMNDSENYCKPSTVIEQFVKRVENFSSQYGSEISVSYTALNLRGPPSNFPDYGDYPQAFVMRTYGKWWEEAPSATDEYCPQNQKVISSQDFIEVSFESKVYPMEVSIFETYNPGALVRIWAWGHDVIKQAEPTWILLWEGEPQDIGETPRVFTPPIKKIYIPIRVLRLEFNHRLLPYYTELDAVLLRGKLPAIADADITSDEKYNAFFELPRMEKGKILKKVLSSNLTAMDCEYLLRKDQDEAHMGPSQGYFQNLPDETILSILKYLDLKSLCRVAQVNKHFNRLASDSVLYKHIDLRPYWNCVRPGLLRMLSYRCKILNKFDISWCGGHHMLQDHDISKFIMKRSAELTHLRMNCCLFVNNTVFDALSFADNLQELCLRSVTNEKLQWSYLSNLSKLKRLDLYRSSIHTMATITIIMRNPELEHINLGSCRSISAMNEVVYALGRNCRNLISADFWKSYSLTAVGLRELANCSNLQELDVGWCLQAGMSGEWLQSLNGEPLRKLFLGALRGVSDRDLRTLIARTPNLAQMDLLGVSGVTPELCNEIFETCSNLRLLDISFCDQLSHQQVAEWRQSFPHVSIKWSLQVSQTSQPHQRFLEPNLE